MDYPYSIQDLVNILGRTRQTIYNHMKENRDFVNSQSQRQGHSILYSQDVLDFVRSCCDTGKQVTEDIRRDIESKIDDILRAETPEDAGKAEPGESGEEKTEEKTEKKPEREPDPRSDPDAEKAEEEIALNKAAGTREKAAEPECPPCSRRWSDDRHGAADDLSFLKEQVRETADERAALIRQNGMLLDMLKCLMEENRALRERLDKHF